MQRPEYVSRVAARIGIDDVVDAFYAKEGGADGFWRTDVFAQGSEPTVYVDDEPKGIPPAFAVIPVPPYLGRNPHNRGLEQILLRAST